MKSDAQEKSLPVGIFYTEKEEKGKIGKRGKRGKVGLNSELMRISPRYFRVRIET